MVKPKTVGKLLQNFKKILWLSNYLADWLIPLNMRNLTTAKATILLLSIAGMLQYV